MGTCGLEQASWITVVWALEGEMRGLGDGASGDDRAGCAPLGEELGVEVLLPPAEAEGAEAAADAFAPLPFRRKKRGKGGFADHPLLPS